jgi:hypothetical protein
MFLNINVERYANYAVVADVWSSAKHASLARSDATWMPAVAEHAAIKQAFKAECRRLLPFSMFACVVAPVVRYNSTVQMYKNAKIKSRGILSVTETETVAAARNVLGYCAASTLLENHETKESLLYSVYKAHSDASTAGVAQLKAWLDKIREFCAQIAKEVGC